MARFPVTLVESCSANGVAALVFDAGFHIIDSTGKIVASTVEGLGDGVKVVAGSAKGAIKAVAFSRDGTLFAACTVDKGLYIYNTESWGQIRSLTTAKRTNAIAFDPKGEYLVTADKFGDAYRIAPYPKTPAEEKPSLLLGHVSILCDIKFTYGEHPFVLTCDRDEKLRVSKYPNSYNIQAFGLGHTEFVTSVAAAQFAADSAVTGSGDGTVRLWSVDSW
ncbi:WD40 repeat-like protein [Martensiomyces pterosporus]|nr:WD40 repeat-like protein [Martensiomyces pterosporus]